MSDNYSSESFDFPSVEAMIDYLREECWEDANIMKLLHNNRVEEAECDHEEDGYMRYQYVYTWGLQKWEQSPNDCWFNVQTWWEG